MRVSYAEVVDDSGCLGTGRRTGIMSSWYKAGPLLADGARTLGELDFWRTSGVTVISILRDGRKHSYPPPSFELAAEDLIYVTGTASQLGLFEQAFHVSSIRIPTYE